MVKSNPGGVKVSNLTWQEAGETSVEKVYAINHVEDQRGNRKAAQE